MTSREIIDLCIDGRSEYNDARKPKNQKLFPFYIMATFKVTDDNGQLLPLLKCDYCGDPADHNGSFYFQYIVFEKPGVIKSLCSVHSCENAPDNLMDFSHQIYGFRNPIILTADMQSSTVHRFVYDKIIGANSGVRYWLQEYDSITQKIYKEKLCPIGAGGTYGEGFYGHNPKGLKLFDNDYKLILTVTPAQIVKAINEILFAFRNSLNLQPPVQAEEYTPVDNAPCDGISNGFHHREKYFGDPSHLFEKIKNSKSTIVKPFRNTMQITHVKLDRNVNISYQENAKSGDGYNVYKVTSQETPVPEFATSLQALAPCVPEILGVPSMDIEFLRVMGITLVYKGENKTMGFTITSKKPCDASNSPAIFNTPLVFEETEGGNSKLPSGIFEKIRAVIDHAVDYINGERASSDQMEIFGEGE